MDTNTYAHMHAQTHTHTYTHTHTHIHTHVLYPHKCLHRNNFKKSGMLLLACSQHMPGLVAAATEL